MDADRFVDFYESKGWMVGKNKMKDWRAAVRTWERESHGRNNCSRKNNTLLNYKETGKSHPDLGSIEMDLEEL